MSIYLNSVKIPGHNQKITANLTLKSVDMSGKTSYTKRAETGDKPKAVGVSTQIKYADPKQLTRIIDLAESKNGNGERTVYNIINNTANAMRIRQVQFDGDVQVREDASLELWTVTFELIEYNSTSEKKEQRKAAKKDKKKVKVQTSTGTAASKTPNSTPTEPATTDQTTEPTVELTRFEKALKKLDDKLS
jgi:hypothetical protein